MAEAVKRSLLLTVLVVGITTSLSAAEPAVTIVVHPDNGVASITEAELSKIFLKRLRTWTNGNRAAPVDQLPDSPARREFSRRVHHRSVVTIEVYWKRMIFSGRAVPPPEMTSNEQVLEFVRSTPGGVGYVTGPVSLAGVRELALRE